MNTDRHRSEGVAKKTGGVLDKNLHVLGRALLRRPRVHGTAAALPYQEAEDFCHAPTAVFQRVNVAFQGNLCSSVSICGVGFLPKIQLPGLG
jgi:hypothetical protein